MKKYIILITVFIVTVLFLFMIGDNFFTNNARHEQPENNIEQRLNVEQFREHFDNENGVVIDVRTQNEYDAGHLALADYQFDLLNGEFEAQLDSLDKSETYYLYCRSGNRSGQALKKMKEHGFDQVYNIGGYPDLKAAGFEVKSN